MTTTWEEPMIQDTCCWQVKILSRFSLGEKLMHKRQRAEITRELWAGKQVIPLADEQEEIFSILNWNYPFKESETLPSKLFVTQIRENYKADRQQLAIQVPEVVSQPQFVDPVPRLNAQQRGTAMHKVMQHLSLTNMDGALDSLSSLLEILVDREILTALERSL